MPRYSFAQTRAQSCGAVAVMVAMAELGVIGAPQINAATETQIWRNIWRGNAPNESPVSYVANFFIGNDRNAQLYEDQTRIANLMAASPAMVTDYGRHRDELSSAGMTGQISPLLPLHFADNARIVLAVIIAATGQLHYLLARQEGGGIWVMNPDSGMDTQQPDLFAWANGPAGGARDIGGVNYIFTGIFVRVT